MSISSGAPVSSVMVPISSGTGMCYLFLKSCFTGYFIYKISQIPSLV
jgi:hypothetical protein